MRKPSDPNGRHVRVYVTLLNSPAYRVLGFAAKALFMDLREKVNGSNNGNIEATLTTLKHKGWTSPGTLANALYELRALGFIAQTRGGGVEFGSKVCALYRFTDLETFDQPKLGVIKTKATHDYLQFQSVGEAEEARKAGVKALRDKAIERKKQAAARKTTLRNSYRDATESVAIAPVHRYENCSNAPSTATKTVAGKRPTRRPKALSDQGFAPRIVGGLA